MNTARSSRRVCAARTAVSPRRTRLAAWALPAALAFALAGCGGADVATDSPEDASAAGSSLTVAADDLFYDPDRLTAEAGSIAFTVENVGAIEHDLIIEEVGDLDVVGMVAPGETATGSVELDAGTYTLYCSVPGHRAAGMEAMLEVS